MFRFFLVSVPTGQIVSPMSQTINTSLSTTISNRNRFEQLTKILRTNRPTVNSLMHLYGPWILDACLLQMKDRYSRSSTIVNVNERMFYFDLIKKNKIKFIFSFFLVPRMNDIDKTLDIQVFYLIVFL